ncbi:hypothetical protein [Falsiroseomonas sp. HW251]|uniref:hypothetical protein n=1 Tax=Falsiroseomonas sp. HW251 TaxID=3390998 RepID=UPI003D31FBA5
MATAASAGIARRLKARLRPLRADRRGSTVSELAVIAGVVVVVGVMAITSLGSGVRTLFGSVAAATATTR